MLSGTVKLAGQKLVKVSKGGHYSDDRGLCPYGSGNYSGKLCYPCAPFPWDGAFRQFLRVFRSLSESDFMWSLRADLWPINRFTK